MIVLNHLKSVTFVIHCVFGVCLLRCVWCYDCVKSCVGVSYCVVSSVICVKSFKKCDVCHTLRIWSVLTALCLVL